MVGEDELKWKIATGIHITGTLVRQLAVAAPRELVHAIGRLRGRYDTAIATPIRLGPTGHDEWTMASLGATRR